MLLSDGEDYGGEVNRQLAVYRQEGHHINSIGIGSDDEVPVPEMLPDGSEMPLRDEAGRIVRTRFEESMLRELATSTGGRYLRSRTGGDLDQGAARDRSGRAQAGRLPDDHRIPRPVSGGAGAGGRRHRRPLALLMTANQQEQQTLNAQAAGEIVTGLEQEIGKVIVGQHTLIRRMLTALFAAIPFAVSQGRARVGLRPPAARRRAGRGQDADRHDHRARRSRRGSSACS